MQEEFKDTLDANEVEHLLELEGVYQMDNPTSTGNNFSIQYVAFRGVKSFDEGKIIDFRIDLEQGVNMLIADNLKGKSSILKIIKLAITGKDSIKKDIKSSLNEILLGFSIRNKHYTIHISLKSNMTSKVFAEKINNWIEIEKNTTDAFISTTSIESYREEIESFFFKQFSYYSLKWTQKSSQKDDNRLLESNSSWITHFKSIFLESKDSVELIFGTQSKKIFQMLLGLKLTYPINRLSIKKDFLNFEKSKEIELIKFHSEKKTENKKELQNEILKINEGLQNIKNKSGKELLFLSKEIEELNKQYHLSLDMDKKMRLLLEDKDKLNEQIEKQKEGEKQINNKINSNYKKIKELEEYLEIGIFFSNLDIKQCPSCNSSIPHKKKIVNIEHKECSLCSTNIEHKEHSINNDGHKTKIQKLKNDNKLLETFSQNQKRNIETTNVEILKNFRKLGELKNQTKDLKSRDELNKLIQVNEDKTKSILRGANGATSIYDTYISKKAVLEFKLLELEKNNSDEIKIKNNYVKKIALLDESINRLKKIRFEISQSIINKWENLMLIELRLFGLNSISEVKISENFDIKYNQNGSFVGFDEIAEGEQLRAKIALYLSLIQLDIEHNFGKHTRFLMIDSPSKEEGDENYLTGLRSVLSNIQERYGEELQIIICTAERKLEDVVENQIIFEQGKFIF